MSRLAVRPVALGAAVAAGVAVAIALTMRVVSESSNLGFGAFAGIMVGMAVGGYVAARPQTDLAFTAGGLAAFAGSFVAQLLSFVVQSARGTEVTSSSLVGRVFTLLISASFGVVGGYLALRRDQRSSSIPEETPT